MIYVTAAIIPDFADSIDYITGCSHAGSLTEVIPQSG
jgi:hypothetical protein